MPSLELDGDVLRAQVKLFKETVEKMLSKIKASPHKEESPSDSTTAKILEEMKVMVRDLPARIESRVSESTPARRKRRRLHPMMFERMMMGPGEDSEPIGLLIMAGLVRDDVPWLYELAVETYRTVKHGTLRDAESLLKALEQSEKMLMRGPHMEEIIDSPEMDMMMHEFPHMLRHVLQMTMERKRKPARKPE